MLKIFMACDHPLPPELYGGIQYYVVRMADAIQMSGHNVEVFSPIQQPSHYSFRVNAVKPYGILFADGALSALKSYALGYHRMLHALRERLKSGYVCDILHTHNPFISGNAGRQIIKETGIPAVLSYYGWDTAENYIRHKGITLTERVARFSLTGYRKIIVHNSVAKQALKARFGVNENDLAVLPLAVDTNFFSPGIPGDWVRDKYNVPPNDTLILFVGSIGKQKGIHILLHALREGLRNAQLHLLVAGTGPFFEGAKRLALELDISSHTTFAGNVAEEDLPAFFNACDIFVNPSLDENYSLVVLEASACGKAVIGTDHPIMRQEYANGDQGHIMLCPAGDINKLAEAVVQLSHEPRTRHTMGVKARVKVESAHSLDKYRDSLLDIYEKVIASC